MNQDYHIPVLPEHTLHYLFPKKGNVVVDATFGFGGHSKLILDAIGEGHLIAIDQDEEVLNLARKNFKNKNIEFVNDNFRNLTEILTRLKEPKVDAILADLGISSYHFDLANRGFSFKDDELDMRLSKELAISAYEIVNSTNEKELADLLYNLADEYKSRRIAKCIVENRRKQKIESAKQLSEIISRCIGSKSKINPSTKTFQALRIAVNDEFKALNEFLNQAVECLKPGGRLVVISFHSGEDRIVKTIFKQFERDNLVDISTKKPIVADLSETRSNPRSRSAKLRAVIRRK